ncbi:MAG: long-chain fatty acid--CoA ligase [Deltaproteobacteria bacterium]|jgi:long-chain acyl-CoA synthetase|nr:long-chain fatty acid--CoA ligase [Deltaproteobacteria bacterium]
MNDTIISGFYKKAAELSEKPCVHLEIESNWVSKSWNEVLASVQAIADALIDLGIKKGDRVIIYGRTRFEWAVADFAVMAAGGICVPIYQSFNSERVAYILNDTKPTIAFVEDEALLQVLDDAMRQVQSQEQIRVISMEDLGGVISMQSLIEDYKERDHTKSNLTVEAISPDDIATYVYTSGTTGSLKGVVLTHANLIGEVRAIEPVFSFSSDEIGLLWLPLAHVLGRMMEVFHFVHGCQTAFANDMNRLPEIYREIRPHFVCGVPRMLEKIYERVHAHIDSSSRLMRLVFKWAFSVGLKYGKLTQKHRFIRIPLRIKYAIAKALIFKKLKSRLGGRLYCFICGGARLPEDVGRFFHSVGISVLEGYGLTETFAAITVNRFDDYHFGTVGKPLPGFDIKLASDGEILIRGSTVFKEYLNRPEDTKAVFTNDGWFKSGDIGEYSRDGFLRITGRKKEIIITAAGKNVAPQMIETIMTDTPCISHFVVFGDDKRYLVGLVTLNEEESLSYLEKHGYPIEDPKRVSQHPAIRRLIWKHIEEKNKKLASYETIKQFKIVDGAFTIDGGELTPTLKLRRGEISKKYRDQLDSMY